MSQMEIWSEIKNKIKDNSEEICEYCKHSMYCSRGITSGGGEPIYTLCVDADLKELIDIEEYISRKEEK